MSKLLNYFIQPFSLHDGNGIRTTLFLKGCSLSCAWCHNPESISHSPQMSFDAALCTGCNACYEICDEKAIIVAEEVNHLKIDPGKCTLCGDCEEICRMSAVKKIGEYSNIENIAERLLRDTHYYDASGGGVTISGGEPFCQADELLELLKLLKQNDVNVLVESSCNVPWKSIEKNLPYIDQFFIDIKIMDSSKHKELTGQENTVILENIEKLISSESTKDKITLRMPVIPGLNDSEEDFVQLSEQLKDWKFPEITLLKYHQLYESKIRKLNYCTNTPTKFLNLDGIKEAKSIEKGEKILSSFGISVSSPLPKYERVENPSFFSNRINRLKHEVETVAREICTDRTNIACEFYSLRNYLKQIFSKKPSQIERAEFISYYLRNKKKIIYDDELIVGNYTSKRVSGPIFPELHGLGVIEDVFNFQRRNSLPLEISIKERIDLLKLYPYFGTRNILSRAHGAIGALKKADKMLGSGSVHALNEYGGFGHFLPNWEKILRLGINGLKDEVLEFKKQAVIDENEDKILFYESLEIVCDGMKDFVLQYSYEAEKLIIEEKKVLGNGENNNQRRIDDLLKIKEVCENIAFAPPNNLHEALQLMLFFQTSINNEAIDQGICPGRLDVLLYAFYEQDVINEETRKLTEEEAKELIACFFIKLNELIPVFPERANHFHSGNPSGQTVNVGGTGPVPNELTFLILEIQHHLSMRQPNFYVRIAPIEEIENVEKRLANKKLIQRVSEILRDGRGCPALSNDRVVIPLLMKRGFELKEAEDYILLGCVEPATPQLYGSTDSALISLATALERAIDFFRREKIVPKSIEEVKDRYQIEIRQLVSDVLEDQKLVELELQKNFPVPLSSICVSECIENGKDANLGGAKYNATGVQGVGIADIGDSFAVIDSLVFQRNDDQVGVNVTWEELLDMLERDFENYEDLHRYILDRCPKYGNGGESIADEYVQFVMNDFNEILEGYENQRDGKIIAGFYSMTTHRGFGSSIGALPNGRKKFTPLASGVGPVSRADREGPIGSCQSVSKLDPLSYSLNGYNFNLTVDTSFMEENIGETAIMGLIGGFFNSGGMQAQMNAVDPSDLIKAKQNPDEYPNLIVRVSGYSSYFRDLDDEMKDEIISRFI